MKRPLLAVIPFLATCTCEAPPTPSQTSTVSTVKTAASAVDTLDQMDTRAPVPLLPMMAHHQKENMRDHLVAVQEIVTALAMDDFEGVERAAGRIGFSEQMGQMCTHIGRGAPDFTEQALNFHHTADRITTAARERDRARTMTELGATLKTCTSCHAAWKQQVVDEQTWARLTSSEPPTHGGAH